MTNNGILYLIGTPIGNLEDITLRALRILKSVRLIACEDTRETLKLLNHYDIKIPLTSYNEYNKIKSAQHLLNILKSGKSVGVTCDRGMPGISDAGVHLVKEAIKNGITVIPIPGPTALITALVVSGLPTGRFVFEGFLPRKPGKLRRLLKNLSTEEGTIVFYESPHRLLRTLKEMFLMLGDRNIVVCRELTKKFEEVIHVSINQAIEHFKNTKPLGEFTLVVDGKKI